MLSNTQIRQQATQVLQQDAFQQYVDKTKHFDLLKWLLKHFHWKLPFEFGPPGSVWMVIAYLFKTVLILLGLFLVGWLGYLLYQKLFRRPPAEAELSISEGERIAAQESYTQLAGEALKHKDYRQAIHFLFLATVSRVIQDEHFHGAQYLTNREIAQSTDFSRFSQHQPLSQLFQTMVYFDEPRWFGREESGQSDYDEFNRYYETFQNQVSPHAS